nr:MAG TPA: hypothetical protein [Caudoviricetes sp.]
MFYYKLNIIHNSALAGTFEIFFFLKTISSSFVQQNSLALKKKVKKV